MLTWIRTRAHVVNKTEARGVVDWSCTWGRSRGMLAGGGGDGRRALNYRLRFQGGKLFFFYFFIFFFPPFLVNKNFHHVVTVELGC